MVNMTKRFDSYDNDAPAVYDGVTRDTKSIWAVTMHNNSYTQDGQAVYLQVELVQAPGINEHLAPQTNPHAKLDSYTNAQGEKRSRPSGVRYTMGQYEKIANTAQSTGNFIEGHNAQGQPDGRAIALVKAPIMFIKGKNGSPAKPMLNTAEIEPVTEMKITPEFQDQQIEVQQAVSSIARTMRDTQKANPNMTQPEALREALGAFDAQAPTQQYAASRMSDLADRLEAYEATKAAEASKQTAAPAQPAASAPQANQKQSVSDRIAGINKFGPAQQNQQVQQQGPEF